MFGYLQIQKSELLVREYEAYKAVYCGLCRQMGKDYSVFTRFTLSYDCTFYAMLLKTADAPVILLKNASLQQIRVTHTERLPHFQ